MVDIHDLPSTITHKVQNKQENLQGLQTLFSFITKFYTFLKAAKDR
jgi:hypothetical protein